MSFIKEGLNLNSECINCVYASEFTNYLPLLGDMPPVAALDYGKGVTIPFDLSNYLSQDQITDFKSRCKNLPRLHFNELIIQIISSINDGNMQEAVASNLLELFNSINAAILPDTGLDNWGFEQLKMEAVYQAAGEEEFKEFDLDALTIESMDKQAEEKLKVELEQRYCLLKPLKDEFLQAQRSIAFKLLLDKGALASAKMVIDFYETLSDEAKQLIEVQAL